MPQFQTLNTIALAAVTALIVALPAQATTVSASFAQLDTNVDAVIDFAEFSAFAKSQGQTRTQAAQTFIKLANGDVLITKTEYLYGVSVEQSPTWKRGYTLPDLEDEVEAVETLTLQGKIIEITPNEEVAGEVIRAFEDGSFETNTMDDDLI